MNILQHANPFNYGFEEKIKRFSRLDVHSGSWFGLPDFGITEAVGGLIGNNQRTAQGGSNLIGSNNNASTTSQPINSPTKSTGQVPSASNSIGGGNSAQANTAPQTQQATNTGQQSGPSLQDIINQQYQATQDALGGLESNARQQTADASGQVNTDYTNSVNAINQNQATQEKDLQNRTTQAGLDTQQAATRIKQGLSDLVNRNNAMLASLGGGSYGSSVGQALAEKLGRTAQSQMGGLDAQRVSTLNAINLEGQKVHDFFSQSLAKLESDKNSALQGIQTQLQQRLGQIDNMRGENAINKAKSTMQAWQDYTNNVAALRNQTYSYQQELTAWALQKTNDLTQAQQYAVANTPTINPAQFGVVAPNQGVGTGLAATAGNPNTPIIPASGVNFNIGGNSNNPNDPNDPNNLYSQVLQGLPQTISQ